MSASPRDIAELVRAVQARVPLDAARLLRGEPIEVIEAVLNELPSRLARSITAQLPEPLRRLTDLEEETPDKLTELMEPAQLVLPQHTSVEEAITALRSHPSPREVIYVYVLDARERLCGLVVLRDLLLAEPTQSLQQLMLRQPFALASDLPLSDALKAALGRHYPVYPIVDREGHLLGIVRGWRLFERQTVEITAQSGQMMGVHKEERVFSTLWQSLRSRHGWLQVNLITAFGATLIVSLFDATIARFVILAAFLPVLSCLAGNNGCQTLAITVRGITLGDLDGYPLHRLLLKELMIGAVNGLGTGVVGAAAMWLFATLAGFDEAPLLALVMLMAMVGACICSSLLGTVVPLTLRRLGADPATASSIFVLTVTDILGMGLMLLLATTLL
jgi:Mg/Co/Ni transporter MgtE (contains CBS domain)